MLTNKKILIVDDNLQNIKLLGQLLRDKEYKISIAESGEEALENITSFFPDLILLDIIMPGINGYETCKKIKQLEGFKETPVIFLSALKDSINKVEGFSAGGVDYLSKPIDSEELYARIKTHLTISDLRAQLEEDISLKDQLISKIKEKTEELILTQKHLVESQKIASHGYLVTGMAHELNTPLSIGITSSSMIDEKVENLTNLITKGNLSEKELADTFDDICESNKLIMKNLKRLDTLIRDFKQLSTEQMNSVSRTYDLTKLIKYCIKMIIELADRDNIDFSVTGDEIEVFNSYPEAMERVITDLTNNSIIHGFQEGKEGKILVNIKQGLENLVIDYSDNGIGIDNKIKEKIFDPFFSTSKSVGTGLGLSVIYNIVTQKLKGKISYMQKDSGTHFIISLPINNKLD